MTVPVTAKIVLGVGAATAAGIVAIAEQPYVTIPIPSGEALLAMILLAQTALQVWERRMRRKWEVDDRASKEAINKALETSTSDLKAAASTTARMLAADTCDIKASLAENTSLTREVGLKADAASVDAKLAFKEANNLNVKIEKVGDMRRAGPDKRERSSDIGPAK